MSSLAFYTRKKTKKKERKKKRGNKTVKSFKIQENRENVEFGGEKKDFLNKTNKAKMLKEIINKFDC